MKTFKKNIILCACDENKSEAKGVFTIERTDEKTNGILRIYNLNKNFSNYILGVMVDGMPMQKIALGSEVVFCKVDLKNEISFNSKIVIVVVSNENLKAEGVVWGASENFKLSKKPVDYFNVFETPSNIEKIINSEIKNAELDKITKSCDCKINSDLDKCKNCEYRNYFYSSNKQKDKVDGDIGEGEQLTIKNISLNNNDSLEIGTKEKTFYQLIEKHLDKMFSIYPAVPELTNLIDNSKWVKISQGNGNFYYIGLLFENGEVKYIAYAVTGDYSENPPNELGAEATWLPMNALFPQEAGYWLMFQDAVTGL